MNYVLFPTGEAVSYLGVRCSEIAELFMPMAINFEPLI